ncbi:MAG TPA: aminotransferase class I/II-fold pyridoxal phosphate-dependent enzyme, partial [Thermomicrobiales bacterium]|nr:aminotransferase class I/II-fold pyridoxal phosphate-dependent enzyme [Thermomicrobiales bacterium]
VMDNREFLGYLERNLAGLDSWRETWPRFDVDESLQVGPGRISSVMAELIERLHDNYPFFHPRYAGQMLKPPHPVAMLAYATAMQINPNNHALDGGEATSRMEREAVSSLADMLGYGEKHLGHLTASGTIANLEALWIARSIHPDKAIAISDQAHYTHGRACELLRVEAVTVPTDGTGRMHLGELDRLLDTGEIGTVVATIGSTALGALDPLDEIIPVAQRAGARVHVDAAYGGFFRLLALREEPEVAVGPFSAFPEADSIVIDPHKHGLQPYGCGAVLFQDPAVGAFYRHDSPYTYFTSDELHLGEISLECSRAGASAAALWATLQCLPLAPDEGLGPVLSRTRQAAIAWAKLLEKSDRFKLVVDPQLDIVTFYATPAGSGRPRASQISALTDELFSRTMHDPDEPLYLATLEVRDTQLSARDASIVWDQPTVRVLRSVVMKPEHLAAIPDIHRTVERHLREYEE